jgi:hypothetical protein
MLAALIALLFLGGGSDGLASAIADRQKELKQVVVEDKRRDEALAVIKDLKARGKAYEKSLKMNWKQTGQALSGAGVAEADIDAAWEALYRERTDFEQDVVDARFQLRELLTREEWQQLFAESSQE